MSCCLQTTTHAGNRITKRKNMRIDFSCETCGKSSSRKYAQGRIPSHFFCSVQCQNEWQKTRKDIIQKNKDPEFRKKVSSGLKRRKLKLGNNYHSMETKRKIGRATLLHWENYDDATKIRLLDILRSNARHKKTHGPYDYDWQKLSSELRRGSSCIRCGGSENLCVHHIVPVSESGTREKANLVVLCDSCHGIVDQQQKKLVTLLGDWEVVHLLVAERLGKII
jgi:5-methylcytosine-specific restriction endonuclease McrA